MPRVRSSYRFAYPREFTGLPGYSEHRGQIVKVLRRLTPDEADREVGPMFEVQAADGWKGHAFAEELQPI